MGEQRGAVPEVIEAVEVEEGASRVELELGPVDRAEFLEVHCKDARGRPVLGARFRAFVQDSRGGGRVTLPRPLVRAPGVYWIALSSMSREQAWEDVGRLQLSAISPAFGEVREDVPLGTRTVAIAFDLPADLSVSLEGDDGRRHALYLESPGRGEGTNIPGRVSGRDPELGAADVAGRALFPARQPGSYRLHVFEVDDAGRLKGAAILVEDLVLVAGANEAQITLPTRHQLRIDASSCRAGSRFQLTKPQARTGVFGYVDQDRNVVFEAVPAGRYLLTGPGHEREALVVDVPCGQITW